MQFLQSPILRVGLPVWMRSVPGAVATGYQHSTRSRLRARDPVATAPGTDLFPGPARQKKARRQIRTRPSFQMQTVTRKTPFADDPSGPFLQLDLRFAMIPAS